MSYPIVSDSEPYKPLRDAKGRLLPGQKPLNRTGLEPRLARMVRDLGALTPKAIKTLERLLDDPNPSAALGAAKEVLDRNLGKVKQNVSVDVTSTHVLHLEALQFLAEKKRAQLQAAVIASDATLDGKGSHEDSALTLSASDYSATVEAPRPPEAPGADAYAPPTPATPQNSTPQQDETP